MVIWKHREWSLGDLETQTLWCYDILSKSSHDFAIVKNLWEGRFFFFFLPFGRYPCTEMWKPAMALSKVGYDNTQWSPAGGQSFHQSACRDPCSITNSCVTLFIETFPVQLSYIFSFSVNFHHAKFTTMSFNNALLFQPQFIWSYQLNYKPETRDWIFSCFV